MLVKILLSSYNGELYIEEQIDSILAQKTSAGIKLLVRDDGSTDSTPQILERYSKNGALEWYGGENLNCAKSFWNLLLNSGDADYYAFCDQDDFWEHDKIESAVAVLKGEDDGIPLLYAGNYLTVDKFLKPITKADGTNKRTSFGNALIKSLAPGCTFVFNKKAAEMLRMYSGPVDIHDWMVHKIVAGFGKVIYDPVPHILYRQHGNNAIGVCTGRYKSFKARLKRFFNGAGAGVRSKIAKCILEAYDGILSEENKSILRNLAYYKDSFKNKLALLKDRNFKLGSKSADFQFAVLVLLNKV